MRWHERLFRRKRAERRLAAELEFHLDRKTAELIAAGIEQEEARRRASIEFGSLDRCQEECRDRGRGHGLESWLQDLRYGLRQMRRATGFTAVAILTLALGIGANIAIFSLLDTVLWHPLPYARAGQLFRLYPVDKTGRAMESTSYPMYQSWRQVSHTFRSIAAYKEDDFNLAGNGPAISAAGLRATANLLPLLGVQPLLGRNFSPDDGSQVVLLSYGLWRQRFAYDRKIVGKTLLINGQAHTVIGVLPPRTYFPPNRWGNPPRIWLPVVPNPSRNWNYLRVLGRLAPGVSSRQAAAEIKAIAAQSRHMESPPPLSGVKLQPLEKTAVGGRGAGWALFGAVTFVLLIACANLANLLLVRGAARERELAIRGVLGASRRRLARQLLTENLLLALGGGLLGLALAAGMLPMLARMAPPHTPFFARVHDYGVHLNFATLIFGIAATLVSVVLFGLAPAWKSAQPEQHLRSGIHTDPLRGLLVAGEFALALILLAGAGLMLRSLRALESVQVGFRTDHLLTLQINPAGKAYGAPAGRAEIYARALRRLRALPGVRQAAAISAIPLTRNDVNNDFEIPGAHPRRGDADYNVIGSGLFHTLGVPMLRGREFTPADGAIAPKVCMINQTLSQKYWPGENPLGRRVEAIRIERQTTAQGTTIQFRQMKFEIVGIVGDMRQLGLDAPPRSELYLPYRQYPSRGMGFLLRTAGAPAGMAAAVRNAMAEIAPEVPVTDIVSMRAVMAGESAGRDFLLQLLGAFGLLAAALAAIGIYGTAAYALGRRTHEIGIRRALGAERNEITGMAMKQAGKLILPGLAAGLAGSLALMRLLSHLIHGNFQFRLYGVGPNDPITLASSTVVLVSAALLAAYLPARRAAKADPWTALRYE